MTGQRGKPTTYKHASTNKPFTLNSFFLGWYQRRATGEKQQSKGLFRLRVDGCSSGWMACTRPVLNPPPHPVQHICIQGANQLDQLSLQQDYLSTYYWFHRRFPTWAGIFAPLSSRLCITRDRRQVNDNSAFWSKSHLIRKRIQKQGNWSDNLCFPRWVERAKQANKKTKVTLNDRCLNTGIGWKLTCSKERLQMNQSRRKSSPPGPWIWNNNEDKKSWPNTDC